ncbi:unannotated protein [freshwater metagenome]|uniref:Unannotated protein n=1 Tax=freshwater metagenome TaxID=449393 RepID=A0A6J6IIZ4_9ZZZZ
MPSNSFTLAVLISSQEKFVCFFEQRLKLGDLLLLIRIHDINRREIVIDVHPEASPRLFLVLLWDVSGLLGQVADVAHAGIDDIAGTQIFLDGFGLSWGFNNHQSAQPIGCGLFRRGSHGGAV